ncbi:MAG TPA: uroporphyrinogen decarboxylase family protein [Atribacteraceae bacterium]|nr:uroporphyrinogen decarboxylase family protein [Atribacteraceae bacterium]
MNAKERVKIALRRQVGDRVPVTASFVPEFAQLLRAKLHLPLTPVNPHGGVVHDLEEALGLDLVQFSIGIANSYYASDDDRYTCEWGIRWKQVPYETRFGTGRYTEIEQHPLADDAVIDDYRPPDPFREELYRPLAGLIRDYGRDWYVLGVTVCTIFEGAWYLRGLDRLLMDLVLNEEKAHQILDIPFHYHREAAKQMVQMGVDGIWLGDDVGTQRGMLISPELWRRYLKPRMAALCHELKTLKPDLQIAYHSDGNILPIIDELIEVGIDVLNPIQPLAMDPEDLKKRYGKRLSFWGTIDEQHTLPFGNQDDVKRETLKRLRTMAPGGGFLISPTHHVQLDTPVENFLTFLKTVREYGIYDKLGRV